MLELLEEKRQIRETKPLRTQDLRECLKIFEKEYSQDALENYPELVDDFIIANINSFDKIKESLLDGSMYGFTVNNDREIIGFVLVTTPNYIRRIAVKDEYKNQGIGRSLIKQVEDFCDSDLVVHAAEKAIPFYKYCGFIPNGEFNRDKFPYLPMKKYIKSN